LGGALLAPSSTARRIRISFESRPHSQHPPHKYTVRCPPATFLPPGPSLPPEPHLPRASCYDFLPLPFNLNVSSLRPSVHACLPAVTASQHAERKPIRTKWQKTLDATEDSSSVGACGLHALRCPPTGGAVARRPAPPSDGRRGHIARLRRPATGGRGGSWPAPPSDGRARSLVEMRRRPP